MGFPPYRGVCRGALFQILPWFYAYVLNIDAWDTCRGVTVTGSCSSSVSSTSYRLHGLCMLQGIPCPRFASYVAYRVCVPPWSSHQWEMWARCDGRTTQPTDNQNRRRKRSTGFLAQGILESALTWCSIVYDCWSRNCKRPGLTGQVHRNELVAQQGAAKVKDSSGECQIGWNNFSSPVVGCYWTYLRTPWLNLQTVDFRMSGQGKLTFLQNRIFTLACSGKGVHCKDSHPGLVPGSSAIHCTRVDQVVKMD